MEARITKLNQIGQSLWYDNIERKLLEDGTLAAMVRKGQIRGITSNPSIFNKAISQSDDYDSQIEALTGKGLSREEIYAKLSIQDIQQAADLFTDLYQETAGGDGYVSLEVSPYLARLTAETTAEAKELWRLVGRPNLMVKIPATKEGLPAITAAIAAGINVNVTLIFGLQRYQEVIDAYLAGLEERARRGVALDGIASVASFFISRIDSKVDQRLEQIQQDGPSDRKEKAGSLFGKAALASGKLAYTIYQENFGPDAQRFQKLRELGARPQRALWASTSTKNPAYSDTMYVDDLVGPNTVNTLPPNTLQAWLDHGKTAESIGQGVSEAREAFAGLKDVGIDIDQVAAELEQEGVDAFAAAFTDLLDAISKRMAEFSR